MEAAVGQQCSGEAMPSRCAGNSITRTTLTSRRRTCGRSGLAAGDCCALVEIACSVPDAFDTRWLSAPTYRSFGLSPRDSGGFA